MLNRVIVVIMASWFGCLAVAQNNGNGGQGNGGNQFPGGILIDPDGVVSAVQVQRIDRKLEQQRLKALASAQLPSEMTRASELRKVSLGRLEQECQKLLDAGASLTTDLLHLAGLTQIQYVFVMSEFGDLVLAGPAEGFAAMQDGRVVGVETGRPVLTLDDLLVMLRLPSTNQTLGCSFDPDPGRLAATQRWNRTNAAPAAAAVARQRFQTMANILGNWDVTVFGLPSNSHAALTTVEADFEMKRLALGLRKPAVRGFRSHLDLAKAGENSMRRWWFIPRYDVIERTEDRSVFHLSGPRLQLLSQEELVDVAGNRSDAPFREVSAERYTRQFNRHMPELCRQTPSFAGIQNLFDLAIAVALIRANGLAEAAGWEPSLFLDNAGLPLQKYNVPSETPSLVNVKSARRGMLLGKISGGVTIVPDQVASESRPIEPGSLPLPQPAPAGVGWWWD